MKRWFAAWLLVLCVQPAFAAELPINAYVFTPLRTIDLSLEVAADEEARAQGLMYRTRLEPYDGMAFFFPKAGKKKFWMKNTLIPLDILFVDEAGSIVYIVTGVPLSEEPVGPDSRVVTVVELAGGRAAESGIAVGDKVTYDIKDRPDALAH